MFGIKNNRLCYGDISFALPDGLYLKLCVDNRVILQTLHNTYSIALWFSEYGGPAEHSAKRDRQMRIDNQACPYGDTAQPDIAPIQHMELYGWRGFSFSHRNQMHLYFDITPKLYLKLMIESGAYDIEAILHRPEIKTLLESIRWELLDEMENIASWIEDSAFDEKKDGFIRRILKRLTKRD